MTDLKAAVFTVLEGWALPLDARKILETAYYAQPEQEFYPDWDMIQPYHDRIAELEAQLAQPEQEPVAWRNAAIRLGEDLYSVGPDGYYNMTAKQWLDWALSVVNTASPKPEQEPVAWMVLTLDNKKLMLFGEEKPPIFHAPVKLIPLYTAPSRKPWVGLTDEDAANICMQGDLNDWHDEQVINAVEAKLKEKNGG